MPGTKIKQYATKLNYAQTSFTFFSDLFHYEESRGVHVYTQPYNWRNMSDDDDDNFTSIPQHPPYQSFVPLKDNLVRILSNNFSTNDHPFDFHEDTWHLKLVVPRSPLRELRQHDQGGAILYATDKDGHTFIKSIVDTEFYETIANYIFTEFMAWYHEFGRNLSIYTHEQGIFHNSGLNRYGLPRYRVLHIGIGDYYYINVVRKNN